MNSQKQLLLGSIGSAHGIKGAVKVHSYTADPADIAGYSPLFDKKGNQYFLKAIGEIKGGVIATIKGVTTREQAETLRNTELFVPRDRLPESDEDEYYIEDLVGLDVLLENNESYGKITHIHDFGAGPVVEIQPKDAPTKPEYYPLTKAIFPTIEPANGRVIFHPPETLG